MTSTDVLYTVGHSTRPIEEFLSILRSQDIGLLVDVRTVPRSRRHPQFDGGTLAETLSERGIAYWHERALGGFRQPRADSVNRGWQVPAFRGYADHMATQEFGEALDRLETMASEQPSAIMCAEAQWWRCHRRLISDAMLVRGWAVVHLGLGEPREHELTPLAVVGQDGSLTYPPFQGELELS
jgi:uncharacterized protein (DUF488 family)